MDKKKNSTDAHIRASKKYTQKNYKSLSLYIKPAIYTMIDDYCNRHDVSKSAFICRACMSFISADTLPPVLPIDDNTSTDDNND